MITLISKAISSSLILNGRYRLLSSHNNAVNFVNNENDLFSLHPNVSLMTPFGIVLGSNDYNFVRTLLLTETEIDIVDNSLIISSGARILLSERKVLLKINVGNAHYDVSSLLDSSKSIENGFGYSNHITMRDSLEPIDTLINFLKQPSDSTARNIANNIGNGIGLTPSFDDALVGVLAIIYQLGFEGRYIDVLSKEFDKLDLNKQTTTISKSFIEEAIKGNVSFSLYRLILSLNKDRKTTEAEINSFIKHGHTSGIDTLLGICLAFKYI